MNQLGRIDTGNSRLGDQVQIDPERANRIKDLVYNSPVNYTPTPPTKTSTLGDYVRTVGMGVPGIATSIAEVGAQGAEKILPDVLSKPVRSLASNLQENAKMATERLGAKRSPQFQKEANAPLILDQKEGENKGILDRINPESTSTTLLSGAAESLPGIVAMGGATGLGMKALKGGSLLAPILQRSGVAGIVETHFPSIAKLAESSIPGEMAVGDKVAKLLGKGIASTSAASISEGLFSAGQNASDKRQEAMATPLEVYRTNPLFHKTVQELDPSIPLEQREEKAKEILANRAADHVFTETFKSTAGIAALTGGGVLGDVARVGRAPITSSLLKTVGKEGLKEGGQEFAQSFFENKIGNEATKLYVDPSRSLDQGNLDSAIKGAVAGVILGGAGGTAQHLSSNGKVDSLVDKDGNVTKITNGRVASLYNKYLDLHSSSPDIDSEGYKKTYSNIHHSLDSILKVGEGKEIDPTIRQEVEDAKRLIDLGHSQLIKNKEELEQAQQDKGIAQKVTDEPSVPIVSPVQPEQVPKSPAISMGTDEVETKEEVKPKDSYWYKFRSRANEEDQVNPTFSDLDKFIGEYYKENSPLRNDPHAIQFAQNNAEDLADRIAELDKKKSKPLYANKADTSIPNVEEGQVLWGNTSTNPLDLTGAVVHEQTKDVSTVEDTKQSMADSSSISPVVPTEPTETIDLGQHPDVRRRELEKKYSHEDLVYAATRLMGQSSFTPALDMVNIGVPNETVARTIAKRKETSKETDLAKTGAPIKVNSDLTETSYMKEQSKRELDSGNYSVLKLKDGTQLKVVHLQDPNNFRSVIAYDSKGEMAGSLNYGTWEYPNGGRENPNILVMPKYRRKRLATQLYDIAEKHGGLIPEVGEEGQVRSKEGQLFREGRARNAKQIQEAAEADVSSGTQPPVRQESRDQTVSSQGVRTSGQVPGTASQSVKKEKVVKPKKEVVKKVKEPEVKLEQGQLVKFDPSKLSADERTKLPSILTNNRTDDDLRALDMAVAKDGKTVEAIYNHTNLNGSTSPVRVKIPKKALSPSTPKTESKIVLDHNKTAAKELVESKEPTPQEVKEILPLKNSEQEEIDNDLNELDLIRKDILEGVKNGEDVSDLKDERDEIIARLKEKGINTSVKIDQKAKKANDAAVKAVEKDEGDEDGDLFLVDDNVDFDISTKTGVLPSTFAETKRVVDRILANLNETIKEEADIVLLPSFKNYKGSFTDEIGVLPTSEDRIRSGKINGFVARHTSGKTKIYINGDRSSIKGVVGTLIHELVGHFGVARILESVLPEQSALSKLSKYDNFLLILVNSPELRQDILNRYERWEHYVYQYRSARGLITDKQYEDHLNSLNKADVFEADIKYKDGVKRVKVPAKVAIRFANEHIAEVAKELYFNKEFLDKQVGLGYAPYRAANRTTNMKWLNNVLSKIKHLLRGVFGNYMNDVSTQDLHKIIALSFDSLFDKIVYFEESMKKRDSLSVNKAFRQIGEVVRDVVKENPQLAFDEAYDGSLPEPEVNPIPLPIENISAFTQLTNSGLGDLKDTVGSKMWTNLLDKFNNSPIGFLSTFGNMPFDKVYIHMMNVYKGKVGEAEEAAKNVATKLKGLDSIQNQAIFEYMTTKGAVLDGEGLRLTPSQTEAVIAAKEAIRSLGKTMLDFGLINPETYEKNEDAYLHTVYLKYIDEYRGSMKKTSLLSWMRTRKNKSERERVAFGQIKDVRFLIPETFGTLARDNVLLQMFSAINNASIENNLFWVLKDDSKVKVPWSSRKISVDEAHALLAQQEFQLTRMKDTTKNTFGGLPESIIQLEKDITKLKEDLAVLEDKIVTKAHIAAMKADGTVVNDKSRFISDNYIRLPNKDRFGVLKNTLVRKEIANDLDATTAQYVVSNDSIEKFFAPGGTLERMNRLWKMSKVALNPASWFRNILGNFSLLDLSTSTPSPFLVKWTHEEVSKALAGKESEWWKLAHSYGLFGTTFSAVELQDLNNRYGDELKAAQARHSQRIDSHWDKALTHFDDRIISVFRIAGHRLSAGTSKGFALVEGAFKTVAFRDYVQIWEKQNKDKYPQGYKSLSPQEQQVLFAKAATHANESLFDYSQVPSLVKTLRRVPLGAPFLTFTYKAGPVAVKALIKHPMKFSKYALLPSLLTTIALSANHWDDDDWDRIKRGLSDFYRNNPGVSLFPFKDKNGKAQIIDMGYLIPWNQWTTAGRMAYQDYVEDGGQSPITTTGKAVVSIFNELGAMGGPVPQVIAAMITGKDSFTGKDIATPGASADKKLADIMTYAYNLTTPAWASSSGWLSKMADAYGIGGNGKATVDRFGDIKYTPLQATLDVTGMRTVSVDPNHGLQNRKLSFDKELKDVAIYRRKVIMDRNSTSLEKASLLKDINQTEKLIKKRMMSELK